MLGTAGQGRMVWLRDHGPQGDAPDDTLLNGHAVPRTPLPALMFITSHHGFHCLSQGSVLTQDAAAETQNRVSDGGRLTAFLSPCTVPPPKLTEKGQERMQGPGTGGRIRSSYLHGLWPSVVSQRPLGCSDSKKVNSKVAATRGGWGGAERVTRHSPGSAAVSSPLRPASGCWLGAEH